MFCTRHKAVLVVLGVYLSTARIKVCPGQQTASAQAGSAKQLPTTVFTEDLKRAKSLAESGKRDEAEQAYRNVLGRATQMGDRYAQAWAHRGLGLVLFDQARYPAARTEGEQSLSLFKALQDALGQAHANGLLGDIALITGDYTSARQHYHKALEGYTSLGMLREKAQVVRSLVMAHEPDGDKLLEEALVLARQIGDKNLEASDLHLIADRLFIEGKSDAAQERYIQAAELYQQTGNELGLARVLTSEGRLQRAHGHPEKALPLYQQALELQQKVGDRQGAIQSINAMATAYEHMGEYQKGIELLEKALAAARETGSPRIINFLLGNLAGDYVRVGRDEEAVKILEDLLRQPDELAAYRYHSLSAAYLHLKQFQNAVAAAGKSIEAARAANNVDMLPDLLIDRSVAEQKLEETEAALSDAQDALQLIEAKRAHLVPTDFMKLGFADESQKFLGFYVGLLAEAGQAKRAIEVAEEARARAFLDLMATRDLEAARGQQVASLRKLQGQLLAAGVDPSLQPSTTLDIATRGAHSDASALWNQWISAGDELRSLVAVEPFSFAQLQATTRRLNSTLLSYWVSPDATYIWIVTPDGAVHSTHVELSSKRLQQLVGSLWPGAPPAKPRATAAESDQQMQAMVSAALDTRGGATLALSGTDRKNWHELYRLLIQPVARWLPATPGSLLTIEPHGPLLMLPFAALQDDNGQYLVERFTLHYTPAVSLLRFTEAKRQKPGQAPREYLLIADASGLAGAQDDEPLPTLPGARREVSAIARLLPSSAVTVLRGNEASESQVEALAQHSGVIHFATHGIIRDGDPFESFLVLGASGPGPMHDGRLTAQKIYGLDLHADLVFLSACRSGVGQVKGDGIAGLTRAFFYAGTPSVIASLWDVADEPTNQLVSDFYRFWLRNGDKSRALRSAQLHLLRELRLKQVKVHTPAGDVDLPEDPVFWAGFVLQGEPR